MRKSRDPHFHECVCCVGKHFCLNENCYAHMDENPLCPKCWLDFSTEAPRPEQMYAGRVERMAGLHAA